MASFEKKMIPLEAISQTNEGFDGQMTSKELVDVKIPSRPRRRVVIVAGVFAVLSVVIVAASLIGKYVPDYIRDTSSYAEKGSKDKGIGKPEGRIPSSLSVAASPSVLTETKPSVKATSSDVHQGKTSPLPRMTSVTLAAATSSMSDAPSITLKASGVMLPGSVADQTVIANLVTNTAATSSLATVTKPSAKATSSDVHQGKTSPLPRMTSVTSAAATSSMSDAPSITFKASGVMLPSSVADQTVIANLVTNTAVTSSRTVTKPSAKAALSDFQQGQTSSLPRITSLTSAAATSSMSEAPDIMSTMSDIRLASSVADVAVLANLVPNTESKWSRWSAWTDCTKTCGAGTRHRNRTCHAINQRAVSAPISCAGKSQQVKSCAEWSCPDCSKNCTIGTLNAACDACTCSHHLLTGRILTEDDAPLSDVNISLAETPYNVLAQTNVSGYFSLLGVCAGQQELLVTKAGFVPVTQNATVLTPTTASITMKLEIAVPPFITVHPDSKIRMPGQSVTFCCDGQGNPPPEIEWFKDNNVIDKDLFSYDKTLEIIDARGLNGSYRCRAVNMFGAEFSDSAILEVLELNQDSCSPTPSSKNVTLPPGCLLSGTNSSTVDVGECKPVACLRNDTMLNSSCQDPAFCCGPRDFIQVLVDCGDVMSFNLSKVTNCSCGSCTEKVTILQGIVVGGPEEEPMRYGDVIYGGEVAAYTDRKGKFSFKVPLKVKRAVVTFKDSFYEEFEERSKVFVIKEGSSDFYKIKLKRKPSPISFNASEPLDVPLGSNPDTDSFADLELPEETLLTEDGSVFRGNAKASISVTDSRNLSDVLAAPGDFSTTDEDGEEEILETFGMIKLSFQDESGKELAMSKPMKVFLDPEKLNLTIKNSTSDVPLKLYWLDKKTGRWREAGNFQLEDGSKRRRKRSPRTFFVGTVTPAIARENLNFDAPTTRVAVRVTTDPYPRTAGSTGVVVRVIRREGAVFRGYIEETTTAEGLACIPIWRDKTCHIQVESNGKYMIPTRIDDLPPNIQATVREKVQDNTGAVIKWIEFTSTLDENSAFSTPMYQHIAAELENCQSSQTRPEGSQFTFEEPQAVPDFSILTDIDRAFWEPNGCYIKIKVNGENAMFAAESYKENDLDESGKIGLHIRMSRTITAGGSNIVCLQFSCPTSSAYTYVKVAPLTKRCLFRSIHRDLSRIQNPACPVNGLSRSVCSDTPPAIQAQERWLWIPQSSASQTTYRTFSDRGMGEARCLVGNQGYTSQVPDTITDTGYTLEYDCRLNDDGYKSTVRNVNWTSDGDKCYVKVKVSGRRSVFKAESYKANKRDLYGYSTDITRPTLDDPSASATCLEYRCSDLLVDGTFSENTYITIRPILGNCKFVNTGNNFASYQNQCPYSLPPQQGLSRSVCDVPLPSFLLPIPGLYNSVHYSWQTTEGNCRAGDPRLGFLPDMFSRGYALHYNCT